MNKTMQEMNEQYKDCPVRTSEYVIDGKKYIVKSHFVGSKNWMRYCIGLLFKKQ